MAMKDPTINPIYILVVATREQNSGVELNCQRQSSDYNKRMHKA